MLKKIFSLVIATLLCQPALAEEAKQLLRDKLANIETFQASFSQAITDQLGNNVHNASGKLITKRPQQLYWHTQLPDEVLLVADGDAVWQVDYFVEQITVVDQSTAVKDNPMMLLASGDDTDWNNVSVTLTDDFFVIVPNQTSAITELSLSFSDNKLVQLTSVDTQGQRSILTFNEIQINLPVASTQFEVANADGFVLDDQRNQ